MVCHYHKHKASQEHGHLLLHLRLSVISCSTYPYYGSYFINSFQVTLAGLCAIRNPMYVTSTGVGILFEQCQFSLKKKLNRGIKELFVNEYRDGEETKKEKKILKSTSIPSTLNCQCFGQAVTLLGTTQCRVLVPLPTCIVSSQ